MLIRLAIVSKTSGLSGSTGIIFKEPEIYGTKQRGKLEGLVNNDSFLQKFNNLSELQIYLIMDIRAASDLKPISD